MNTNIETIIKYYGYDISYTQFINFSKKYPYKAYIDYKIITGDNFIKPNEVNKKKIYRTLIDYSTKTYPIFNEKEIIKILIRFWKEFEYIDNSYNSWNTYQIVTCGGIKNPPQKKVFYNEIMNYWMTQHKIFIENEMNKIMFRFWCNNNFIENWQFDDTYFEDEKYIYENNVIKYVIDIYGKHLNYIDFIKIPYTIGTWYNSYWLKTH